MENYDIQRYNKEVRVFEVFKNDKFYALLMQTFSKTRKRVELDDEFSSRKKTKDLMFQLFVIFRDLQNQAFTINISRGYYFIS